MKRQFVFRRRMRPGLRTTITVSFALGALLLSTTMALGTYLTAHNYLVHLRERSATRQAFADASYVRNGLLTSGAKVSDVLDSVSTPTGGAIVVHRGDRWFSSSPQVDQDNVPKELRSAVADRSVAVTWQRTPDGPAVMVGVPLPATGAQFFELTSTTELDRTLSALRVVLTVFAVLTALAGAILGRWAARRVVAPLDDVAGAAARIASGALDTRLAITHDPDLATIVASFNSMVDAVRERVDRDARFAADVSHELRSPLTALITSVAVLDRRRDELSDRSQQALDLISRDLARFQRALENLLDLGRLEAGALVLNRTTVDLRDLVRYTLDASGHSAELLAANVPDEPTVVDVDKASMHHALQNLFENAELHGGGLAQVTIGGAANSVIITVEDRGPGVPIGERERIFDRFARGGSRGSTPGTGLGLSLVLETVRQHGGSVWCADGADGCGARFIVQLPVHDMAQEAT